MGDDGIYIARVMNEKLYAWRPSSHDVQCLADNRTKDWTNHGYFGTLRLLMLAGFCLLLSCSPAIGEDVFKPTGRYAVAKPQRQWYLVSEPYCSACPAAKAKFLSLGWTKKNVLTMAECEAKFGFMPPHVPFEFGEPDMSIASTRPETVSIVQQKTNMSHAEMVALHNELHGGGSKKWPGDLATHLRTVHGVNATTRTSQPSPKPTVMRSQQSACPGGRCPTPTRRRRLFR